MGRFNKHLKYLLAGTITLTITAIWAIVLTPSNPRLKFNLLQAQVTPSLSQQNTQSKGWQNVSLGGGGYVTGIYLHPLEKDLVYIKTDVGGFYRWNPQNQTWIPLTDRFPLSQRHYYGGESLAIDPNNPNIVYIAAGIYLWDKPGTIFKSTNRGQTWTKLNIDLPMGGNETKRWMGERLAVNPFNSNIIFFGSRRDGLWKSSDGGTTWRKVDSFSGKPAKDIGVSGVLFDRQRSGLVYAIAYGDGIYKSTNTGVTWQKIEASPKWPRRMATGSNQSLYVTSAKEQGVTKYANGVWRNITPNNSQAVFNALSVNPANPNQLIVALGETPSTKIYRSADGGATWTEMERSMNNSVPWWKGIMLRQPWISAIEFDPKVESRVWLTDWYGIWRTENAKANPVVWTNYQKGHEELVIFSLVSPPKGSLLLSGVADVDGFYHGDRLDAYPSQKFSGKGLEFQDTYSIDYNQRDPLQLVRVSGNRWNNTYSGATSRDGGLSWQEFSSFPTNKMPIRVAMSATDPKVFVVTLNNDVPIHTNDGGATWQTVTGLPNGARGPWHWSQSLAADAVDGNTFYYYWNDTFYRSTDRGASFTPIYKPLVGKNGWHAVKTVPGIKGEVWVSLDENGLYRSTDAGETFSKINTVEKAYLFAFGKPKSGSTIPALYLYGKITGMGDGIFQSLDRGITWKKISDRINPIGNNPQVMEASKQHFGMVFIGTNGRGIFYYAAGQENS